MIDSLYYSSQGGQNKFRKALLFITNDLNGTIERQTCYELPKQNKTKKKKQKQKQSIWMSLIIFDQFKGSRMDHSVEVSLWCEHY